MTRGHGMGMRLNTAAGALGAAIALLLGLLLMACGSSTMTYTPQEGSYAVGCNYSANIGALDGYCSR